MKGNIIENQVQRSDDSVNKTTKLLKKKKIIFFLNLEQQSDKFSTILP